MKRAVFISILFFGIWVQGVAKIQLSIPQLGFQNNLFANSFKRYESKKLHLINTIQKKSILSQSNVNPSKSLVLEVISTSLNLSQALKIYSLEKKSIFKIKKVLKFKPSFIYLFNLLIKVPP